MIDFRDVRIYNISKIKKGDIFMNDLNGLPDGHYVIYDAQGHKQCVEIINGVITIKNTW